MSLIDIGLQRRSKSSQGYRPDIEVLEHRECPSVSAPAGVQLTAVSPSQIKVAWNDQAGETGYRILRWNGTQAVVVGTVNKNITTFNLSNVPANTVQWFQVQAFDNRTSATSAWASVKTPADAITAPTNTKVASATLTSLTLTWKDSTGETGYRIYSWDGTRSVLVGTVAANTTSFQVQSLQPGTNYYHYVQAFNATNSASSDWVIGTTQSTQLTGPTNTKAQTVNPSTIGLSWTDASAETGYRVYGWDGNSATSPVLLATLAANTTGYQMSGLLPGKTYWFYVQAFNSLNAVANSPWVSGTTTPAAPLQAVSQLNLQLVGSNSVLVKWTEPARAVGYRVFVWSGVSWIPAATVPRGTNTAQIDGLFTNRTQWFMVQSFTDNFAEIAYSNAVFINM